MKGRLIMKTTNASFYSRTNTGELIMVAVTGIPVIEGQSVIDTISAHCENFKEFEYCFSAHDEDYCPNYPTYSFCEFIESYNRMIGSVKNALCEYAEEYAAIENQIIEINAIKDELTGVEFTGALIKQGELMIKGIEIKWDAKLLASKYGLTDFWESQLERIAYVER